MVDDGTKDEIFASIKERMRRDMADYIAEVLCEEDTHYFFFSFNTRAVESWLTPVRISAWHAYWSVYEELFFIEAQKAERNARTEA